MVHFSLMLFVINMGIASFRSFTLIYIFGVEVKRLAHFVHIDRFVCISQFPNIKQKK